MNCKQFGSHSKICKNVKCGWLNFRKFFFCAKKSSRSRPSSVNFSENLHWFCFSFAEIRFQRKLLLLLDSAVYFTIIITLYIFIVNDKIYFCEYYIDFEMLKSCNIVISIPNCCIKYYTCILIIKFYDEVVFYGLN